MTAANLIGYQPDLLLRDGAFTPNLVLGVDPSSGRITGMYEAGDAAIANIEVQRLRGRALLPGLIDVHSHSFQRALRGRAESRRRSGPDFWSWRNTMYRCALALTPDDLFDVSRMAFLEMLHAGITAVGEFHYLHNDSSGEPYTDPNLLAHVILRAADSVGIRIALLRSAYVRAGYQLNPDPGQIRFLSPDPDRFLSNAATLLSELSSRPTSSIGIAPHSVRAVPQRYLAEIAAWAHDRGLPLHMHVSEQPAEIDACRAEYGLAPFELLDSLGLLTPDLTAIHAIHLQPGEIALMSRGEITVGACPTTERNLGDGILSAADLLAQGVAIALGTDSHTQTDPFENARQLEYNLRLRELQRAVLDGASGPDGVPKPLANLLFDVATRSGARSLHLDSGDLSAGRLADFFTVDLASPALAGSSPSELLTNLVFSASPAVIRDVAVHGRMVLTKGQHPLAPEIVEAFSRVQQRLGAEL